MAGKGDTTRPLDRERFRDNFDQIAWGESSLHLGTNVLDPDTGEFTTDILVRVDDAHNLRSEGAGVGPDQVAEANRLYNHEGVKFDANGTAFFRDRNARLKHLKKSGLHCRDEIRG